MTAEFYALKGMFLAQINKYVILYWKRAIEKYARDYLNSYLELEAFGNLQLKRDVIS